VDAPFFLFFFSDTLSLVAFLPGIGSVFALSCLSLAGRGASRNVFAILSKPAQSPFFLIALGAQKRCEPPFL